MVSNGCYFFPCFFRGLRGQEIQVEDALARISHRAALADHFLLRELR